MKQRTTQIRLETNLHGFYVIYIYISVFELPVIYLIKFIEVNTTLTSAFH